MAILSLAACSTIQPTALDEPSLATQGAAYRLDSQRVRQMLSNMVSNAVKFTKSGSIAVRAEEIGRSGDEAVLLFCVTYTGSGISPDKQKLLFHRFEQIDSTNASAGGSGLGLYIVRGLAELMGGEVGVESQASQGARFWFSIRAGLVRQGLPAS